MSLAALALWAWGQRNDAQRERSDAQLQAVEATLLALDNSLLSTAHGLNRYATTRKEAYRKEADRTLAAYPTQLASLARLVSDDPGQQHQVRAFEDQMRHYGDSWREGVAGVVRDDGFDAEANHVEIHEDRGRLDEIRAQFRRLLERERAIVRSRKRRSEASFDRARDDGAATVGLMFVAALGFGAYRRRRAPRDPRPGSAPRVPRDP